MILLKSDTPKKINLASLIFDNSVNKSSGFYQVVCTPKYPDNRKPANTKGYLCVVLPKQ